MYDTRSAFAKLDEIRLEYGERLNCLYEEEMDIFSDRFEEVEDLFNRMMDGMRYD